MGPVQHFMRVFVGTVSSARAVSLRDFLGGSCRGVSARFRISRAVCRLVRFTSLVARVMIPLVCELTALLFRSSVVQRCLLFLPALAPNSRVVVLGLRGRVATTTVGVGLPSLQLGWRGGGVTGTPGVVLAGVTTISCMFVQWYRHRHHCHITSTPPPPPPPSPPSPTHTPPSPSPLLPLLLIAPSRPYDGCHGAGDGSPPQCSKSCVKCGGRAERGGGPREARRSTGTEATSPGDAAGASA